MKGIVAKNFFVDTNVILGYLLKQHPKIDTLIQLKDHRFFYTETVREELKAKESLLRHHKKISRHFIYVDSGISQLRKDTSLKFFHEMWIERFHTSKKTLPGFKLTNKQLDVFKNDLLIVMEASAIRYSPLVLPEEDMRTPEFLTNNQILFKKFIGRKESQKVLEDTINLMGMEHLIPIRLLNEVLEKMI